MTVGRIPSVEGGIQPTLLTTKGDIIVATGNATLVRQGVGTNGQVLTADSTQADGVIWATPSAPAFKGASIYAGSVQNILNNTWTLMVFNSELWDSDGYHSTSTNTSRMTIPTGLGGKYLMTASIVWGDRNANGTRIMQIQKNGGTYFFGLQQIPSSTVYMGNSMSVVVEGVAGDYFEVLVNQSSGSTLATGAGANDQFVQISYLGA